MNRYYEELARYQREGFEVIVDKTWEDLPLAHTFDESVTDLKQLAQDIDSGKYEYFMLRVRCLVEGHELGSAYLGGCLYEDAREVLSDGTAEDQIQMALEEAIQAGLDLKDQLIELCLEERLESRTVA